MACWVEIQLLVHLPQKVLYQVVASLHVHGQVIFGELHCCLGNYGYLIHCLCFLGVCLHYYEVWMTLWCCHQCFPYCGSCCHCLGLTQ